MIYQNCKFHDPQGWGSYVRVWPYTSLYSTVNTDYLHFYQYTALIAIVLRILMLLPYAIVEFYLFYDGAVDEHIHESF